MPGLDGFARLVELERVQPDIKVIMITGTREVRIEDRARAEGARDFLYKPFFAKDIDAALNAAGLGFALNGPVVCRALGRLLSDDLDREFAIADSLGQAVGVRRRGVLAVGGDQFGEGGEQAGHRHAVVVDAVEPSFRPGLADITERGHLLLALGRRLLGRVGRFHGMPLEIKAVARPRCHIGKQAITRMRYIQAEIATRLTGEVNSGDCRIGV